MSNDLLVDLQEEDYSDTLENGALARRNAVPRLVSRYEHLGYHATIMIFHCACGAEQRRLQGIFREEKLTNTTTLRCHWVEPENLPKDQPYETRFSKFSTKVCVSCIGTYGFSPFNNVNLKE